jgi:integrase
MAGRLGHFARFLAACDPALDSLAGLDRQRHIEPWLAAVAAARNPRTGTVLSASERRSRVLTVGRMIDDIIEWGWAEAPARRLIFARDVPLLPRALPRYLPADADRALAAALRASSNPLPAAALLLLRATGMRIGELLDLELDCVHEVPGAGAWLKVPLGKLDTERMVPIDEEALALVDQITEHRSPGRPLPHPRTGKPADFLLTHQGRRVSARPRVEASPWVKHSTLLVVPVVAGAASTAPRPKDSSSGCAHTASTRARRGSSWLPAGPGAARVPLTVVTENLR